MGKQKHHKSTKTEGSSLTLCQSILMQTAKKPEAFFILLLKFFYIILKHVCMTDKSTRYQLGENESFSFLKEMYFSESYEKIRFFSHLQLKQCL